MFYRLIVQALIVLQSAQLQQFESTCKYGEVNILGHNPKSHWITQQAHRLLCLRCIQHCFRQLEPPWQKATFVPLVEGRH